MLTDRMGDINRLIKNGKKFKTVLSTCVCAVAMTACVNGLPGNGSNKPASGPVAAKNDDAEPASFTRDGDYIIFGHYEQDGDTSNGPEPIEWEVLDEYDGGMLLISRYILDAVPYNTEKIDITWEKSSIRYWLNEDFYYDAFDADEQRGIVKVKLSNPYNACWGTKGGKDTEDHVFLLSAEELQKYYSFDTWYDEKMYGYSQTLLTGYTQQAKNNGLDTYTITQEKYDTEMAAYGYDESCIGLQHGAWWLRSPGYIGCRACLVARYGAGGWGYEGLVTFDYNGVRPAIYIKL